MTGIDGELFFIGDKCATSLVHAIGGFYEFIIFTLHSAPLFLVNSSYFERKFYVRATSLLHF